MPKKAVVSVISDLITDQRVHRTSLALAEEGWDVLLIGRKLPESQALSPLPYKARRFRLWVNKGPLFYLFFNIRLFLFLLFKKADLLFSNDLDTLPANFLISRIRSIPLIYDSHEYFTGVPELTDRPFIRRIWKTIESIFLPRVKNMLTVNSSIAELYREEYNVDVKVMRNVPVPLNAANWSKDELRKDLDLPLQEHIYILQGSGINIQRGAEEAVEAMQYIEGLLIIAGGGDVIPVLKKLTADLKLEKRILFTGKMLYTTLISYTRAADIGLTLDKDLSINYRFSLPNKLFDYIHAGIPVLASNLPEVAKVIRDYDIGKVISSHEPKEIAGALKEMTSNADQMEKWAANAKVAADAMNWNMEKKVLIEMLKEID